MSSIHTLSNPYIALLTVFILTCFVGYYVVWKVTPALHTPLMSVTNAISSIIILGALISAGSQTDLIPKIIGNAGIFITAINIFGGFFITHRMLKMYKKRNHSK